MTQIERRARIIRKARRIVILLLIGVTIAIALIDITEEQGTKDDNSNLAAEQVSQEQKSPQGKSDTIVKQQHNFPQNDPAEKKSVTNALQEEKAKTTLQFRETKNEKQVVSSDVNTENQMKAAVENVGTQPATTKKEVNKKSEVKQVSVKAAEKKATAKTAAKKATARTANNAITTAQVAPEKTQGSNSTKNYRDVKEYGESKNLPQQSKTTTTNDRKVSVLDHQVANENVVEETVKNVRENVAYRKPTNTTKPQVPKKETSENQQLIDPEANEYIVQPNDTISHIALHYYGKGKSYYWKYIAQYNNISKEKRLRIKQHLYVPSLAFIEKHYLVKKTIQKLHKKSNDYIYHIVEKGDTLAFIAKKNNITPENLLDSNSWLKRNPKLKVGIILRVPKAKKLVRK